MYFDFTGLRSFLRHSFLLPRGHYRLGLKRMGILSLFVLLYGIIELFSWTGFFFDRLLYPRFAAKKVKNPVFIVGNFRSGTTFLQRTMLKDGRNFTGMRMWEIVFAPSMVQRMAVRGLGLLDRMLGSPVARILSGIEDKTLAEVDFHHLSLDSYEEDEVVLLHCFATMIIWLYSAPYESIRDHIRFDHNISRRRREGIMDSYYELIQRHLHLNPGRRFLSKSPTNTPRIRSLKKRFPDAKFILLVRDPLDLLPSQLNMIRFGWRAGARPLEEYPWRDEIIDMVEHWYRDPLEAFASMDPADYTVVPYARLREAPLDTLETIYRSLDIPLSPDFRKQLELEQKKARSHRHQDYAFEDMGLNEQSLRERFSFVRH